MRRTILPLLCFSLSSAFAQSLNVTGLISALRGAGLTSLADAAQKANGTTVGQQFLNAIVNGTHNYTIFAPNNDACKSLAPGVDDITDNTDTLAAILSYHVLPGTFVDTTSSQDAPHIVSSVYPTVTIGRTLLTSPSFVHLEGGKGQVLAWSKNSTDANATVYFLNQVPEATIISTARVSNLLICTVSDVLIPPPNLIRVIAMNNLTSLAGVVNMATVPGFFSNGTNATIAEVLVANNTRGYTLFAPNNAALESAGVGLTALAANNTALLTLLGNHYINGTSYYSSELLSAPSSAVFTSASGQPFTFSSNSTGTYVASGSNGASARIVKSDVLTDNGVLHIIDRVLVNLDRDETKAENAYSSATSAAAQTVTATGPVGPTSTSPSGGNTSDNGAVPFLPELSALGVLGSAFLGISWLALAPFMMV
ncbi:FAS1 domain-containing protein [Collybia nuda]|uniref:FAS1 domain-containing protein n=1 Tax=Collybia nuda TaxID=64659 RepID=A0A9P5Y7U9_9AGAR|nr:FAS1 domain-containing protein [Collybia nuda]